MSASPPVRSGGSPSPAYSSHHPPPPVPLGGSPSSSSHSPPRPPPAAAADSILDACGRISPSQDVLLLSSPFIGQQNDMATAPTTRAIHRLLGSSSLHPSGHSRSNSDAEVAELALVHYFLRLGPQRLHLLHQRQPQEGIQGERAPFPSELPKAAERRPDEVPPLAEGPASYHLDAAPVFPTTSSESGEERGASLKRGRPDSSSPSRFPSSAGDEGSTRSKKPRLVTDRADPAGDICSLTAGDSPRSTDHCGQGLRKLPPSVICSVSGDLMGIGDEGCSRSRHREALPQVEQQPEGRVPAAGAASAHVPTASSPQAGQGIPTETARTVSSSEVTSAGERGLDKGDAGEPRSPSLTALVEENPPSRVGADAISPARAESDAISLSGFIDILLRFSKDSVKTTEDVGVLEALTSKGIQLPRPKWWRPGGYGRPSSTEDK